MIQQQHHKPLSRALVACVVTSLSSAYAKIAVAEESYPAKPIKLIVASGAGGASDATARHLAHLLSPRLGQPIVIENRPGASGTIGSALVARAAADGYTLLWCNIATHGVNVALSPRLSYDPIKDFAPVVRVVRVPLILAVNPDLPWRSIQDLVHQARAQPGNVRYGSAGHASFTHVLGELLARRAGVKLTHVPYKGLGEAALDVMAGHIDMLYSTPLDLLAQIKAGRLRALAVAGPRRIELLPQVPTMREAGFPEIEMLAWGGLCAPAGTPEAVVAMLNEQTLAAYFAPQVKAEFERQGYEITANKPEQFRTFIVAELARMRALTTEFGIQSEQ